MCLVNSLLKEQNFDFCFRLSTAWKTAYETLELSNLADVGFTVKKKPSQEYGKLKLYNLPTEVPGLRLVSIELDNGEKEVLLTSLTDRELYPKEVLKELYHMRWSVEECYKRIKQVAQMEFFTGRTVHTVEQDFYARIVMLNIPAIVCALQEIKKNAKHEIQINKTQGGNKNQRLFG